MIRKYPYRTPSEQTIKYGNWQIQTDGRLVCRDNVLQNWDPAIPIKATCSVVVNIPMVFKDALLPKDSELCLTPVWKCDGTNLRGVGQKYTISYLAETHSFDLYIDLDGLILAKWIELSVQLVLLKPGCQKVAFSAKYPGSILSKSVSERFFIQGDAALFPIEVIDFNNTPFPNKAGWVLHWDTLDLHRSILSEVRLYINSQHERVMRAVSENRPEDQDIRDAIRLDTARIMIKNALSDEDFVQDPGSYGDGSIGSAVRSLLYTYFQGYSDFQDIKAQMQTEKLGPKLQEKLLVFQKGC